MQTQPAYRLYDMGGFPGMVPDEQGTGLSIEGEVWEVSDECLKKLDVLEAVDEGEYLYEVVPLLPLLIGRSWAIVMRGQWLAVQTWEPAGRYDLLVKRELLVVPEATLRTLVRSVGALYGGCL